MAQPMNCDDHGAPGVLYTSTLQGEVETKVLCADCLGPWAIALVEALGLLSPLREQVAQELRAEAEKLAAKPAKKATAAKRAKPLPDTVAVPYIESDIEPREVQ